MIQGTGIVTLGGIFGSLAGEAFTDQAIPILWRWSTGAEYLTCIHPNRNFMGLSRKKNLLRLGSFMVAQGLLFDDMDDFDSEAFC